jgi:hypothetical protein
VLSFSRFIVAAAAPLQVRKMNLPSTSGNRSGFLPDIARRLLVWHLLITGGYVICGLLVALRPELGARIASTLGPATNHIALIVSLVLSWVLVTAVLFVVIRIRLTTDNLILLTATAVLSLLYLAILRERVVFGDFTDYIGAAYAVISGEPLPDRYLYPPLWASFLGVVLDVLGRRAAEIVIFSLNHISLVAFLPLSVVFLQRCGFSRRSASLLMLGALAVNVTVLRHIANQQIQFIVLDLALIAVLSAPRNWLLAGLALALSTHLKVLPALLVPLFVVERRWRFTAAYVGGLLLFFAATAIPHGIEHWQDLPRNLGTWEPYALRSASVPSFIANSAAFFGVTISAKFAALPIQLALAILVVWLTWLAMKRRAFTGGQSTSSNGLVDGLVPALFLWPIVSPGVWVHHLVVLILPAVIIASRLSSARQWATFIACYFLVFFYPTIDVYPWSYLRLCGWLGLLGLLVPIVRFNQPAAWLPSVEDFLADRSRRRAS